MADKNREDWIKSFYFGEAPKQQNTGGLTLADELDRLYEARQKRNKNNHRLVTRSGHDTFMEDEYGRQFFTYEGWKENQEASVAYMKLAGEALKHLGSGFFEGQGYKRLPQNMTEAGLRALDGIIDLGKGAGRFTAKAWRDDEEENKAAYNAYLSLTGKFLDLQGVYKDEEGNIVPPSTPGAKKVQGPQSYLGNYARGLGDLFNDPVKGEALGESFDEDVNMKWADSWSILLDPTWLIPGGQAAKASNLVDKGVKGEKLARLTKSLKDIAEKVPKSEKLSSAGEWAAQFARRPATKTADLAGKAVSKTGEGIAKAADTKVGKYAVAGTMGYGIYKAIEDDESLIDTLIAGIGTYATAKGAPQYIGKVGAKAKTIGNTISGAARGAQMGSLGIAAKQGGYSQGAIEALKRIDNPAMNRTLRLAGEISDAAVKGSVFGAGMGYLIAGREGAAGGLGVGVLGGPIGMAQGYALGKITGAGKITYATKENGKIVTKEVDSILDIPDQDLVSNFLAQLPSSDREVLTSQLLPPKLLELAKLDAFGRGMLIGGDTGDLNIRYMTTDQIAADPQLRGTLGSAEAGYEGVAIDDYNGKPLVVVNISEAVNPLRTLAHELFHPKFESGDPNDPLMAIRAQLESNLFGIKDQEGNEVVAGQYNDAQFKMLESDYVSMMSEGWQNEYYQRPIQARRSFVAGEILSEAFGNFAEASKGDVVAYANKVNKRAKGTSPEAGLLTNQLYKFQSALLARMQNAFKAMGVEFDAGGNPVSKLFKDPSTARGIKLTGDGRLIGKGGEGLANSPEINALLSEYVLAKDKLLKRLSLADETEGSDGFAVSAKELLSKNDPGTVEKFRNSGMFKLDEQGNVQYENGMPVLLTRKQRKERETTVSMALFQALDSVAAGEYVTGLQRKVHSDGEVSYRGRYMSEEQLAAIMQLPDEVVPQSMKAKIQKLNENLAKGFDAVGNLEGDPAMNFLISYYKATTGSAYTSRASMKHQHVSPYGFSISKAGNFNLETFSISRFENKLNNWWKRAQKGNSKYKKFFDLFGGSPDNFRSAAVQYMHNQVRGVRNEATPQKDAIYDFMNAGEQGMMEQNPDRISTNKEHVVPISLRVDRMEEVNTIMGDTFPVNYGKLKRNFMPAGADKGGAKFMPAGKGDSHALNIIKGTESPEGLPKNPTILNLAKYFQGRFEDPINFKKASLEQNARFEDLVGKEVRHAMEIHPEAKGWYDENLGLAMSVLRELDPNIAKKDNDFFFKAFLAVTSDGNKVDPQFKQAWNTYEHWKKTGEISGEFVSGDRVKNIRNNLKRINKVNTKLGSGEKAAEWLTRKGTVKELRESAVKDLGFTAKQAESLGSGENVDAIIPFASIFGPKLGSFFNNLYGDYSTVTMDRWFMRTVGRNTGTQVKEPSKQVVRNAKNRLRLSVDALTAAERKQIGITKSSVAGGKYIDAARKMAVYFTVKKNRDNASTKVNEVRKAANAIVKMQKPLVEAPEGGGHRKWIRDRIGAVQKSLKADGIDLENADLQALLWYNEKELYESAGVRGPKGANDYASAAESLYASIRGRPSKGFAGGAGRVGGIGRGKGDSGLDGQSVAYMPAGKGGDIFYSNSSKALESPKVRNSATGVAMLNDILRQDPAAVQEMKWIGLLQWLKHKKGKVTKKELQDYIDTNQIAVVEKIRGGEESPELRAAEEAVEDAKRNMYDADDRGTYQEAREAEAAYREAVNELDFLKKDLNILKLDDQHRALPGAKEGSYRELELMFPKRKGEQFTESHFETDENVFAHVRFNERIDADGKRMLFIEELQSDWWNKGRQLGFDKPYINGDIVGGREESIPPAPFVSKQKGDQYVNDDKWRALAFKRMLRWGADNGYDRVGWITGRDSAARYKLNTYVSKIEYMRLPGENQTMISAWDKAGSNVMSAKMIPNKDLVQTVGKDLARKIDSDKSGMGEFDGLDLAMGGKFHKVFYDIDLPNYVNKYIKTNWGGEVGMVEVSDTKAHYVDITPEMKADVQQGQAMFMPAGEKRAKIIEEYDGPRTAEESDADSYVNFWETKQDLLSEIDLPRGWELNSNETDYHTKWGTAYYSIKDPDGDFYKIRIGDHSHSPQRGRSDYMYEINKPATLEDWNRGVLAVEKWLRKKDQEYF